MIASDPRVWTPESVRAMDGGLSRPLSRFTRAIASLAAATRGNRLEADWRWQVTLRAERVTSTARIAVVAMVTVMWLGQAHLSVWTVGVLAAAWCYAATVTWTLFFAPDRTEWYRLTSVALDCLFILVWITSTGGRHSPFAPLIILGVASAPLRLPFAGGVAVTLVYAVGQYLVGSGPEGFFGAYVIALSGFVLSFWTLIMYTDRRNSLRDALTGAFGREFALFELHRLTARRRLPFSVGMIDLDGFKQVNDRYGHAAGDAVLAQLVRRVLGLMRLSDVLARFGGDEFLVIWRDATAVEALAAAERIRAAIEREPFHLRTPPRAVHLTASLGVAEADGEGAVAKLLELADERLYVAKKERNRAVGAAGTCGSAAIRETAAGAPRRLGASHPVRR